MRYLTWLIISVSLSGCAAIPWMKEPVPDEPICRSLLQKETKKVIDGQEHVLKRPNPLCMREIGEPYCGYCVWTVSEKTQYVGNAWNRLLKVNTGKKKTWDMLLAEGLVTPAETLASTKRFAVNVCKISPVCGENISRWRVKFDALDSVSAGLKRP